MRQSNMKEVRGYELKIFDLFKRLFKQIDSIENHNKPNTEWEDKLLARNLIKKNLKSEEYILKRL